MNILMRDPRRLANKFIQRQGDYAGTYVHIHALPFFEAEDEAGLAFWKQVILAIGELEHDTLQPGEAQH